MRQDSEFRFHNANYINRQYIVLAQIVSCSCNVHTFLFLFKDGADLRMKRFSSNQNLHTLSTGANGFTILTTSLLMLKSMFLIFNLKCLCFFFFFFCFCFLVFFFFLGGGKGVSFSQSLCMASTILELHCSPCAKFLRITLLR